MRFHFAALLLTAACVITPAQDNNPEYRTRSGSVGIGYHEQGPMFTAMFTGQHFGVFLGGVFGKDESKDYNLLPDGTGLSWVSYPNKKKYDSSEFHGGLAYRINHRFTIGAGYGYKQDRYYYTGFSPVTGWEWRRPGGFETVKESGVVGMVDVRLGRSWGVEVIGGQSGFGASVCFRY